MEKNNFRYYNPNPKYMPMKNGKNKSWHKDDWPVRAFCAVTGFSWDISFKHLMESAKMLKDLPTSKEVMDNALAKVGFEFVTCGRPVTGQKRQSVTDFAEEHKDELCVCNIPGKFVACIDGEYLDTEDCGSTVVYSYWKKSK